jgi:hypothetical protein
MEQKTPPIREVNMSTVHLELLGIIHDLQWIAAIETIEIIKAEPFLTLPSNHL